MFSARLSSVLSQFQDSFQCHRTTWPLTSAKTRERVIYLCWPTSVPDSSWSVRRHAPKARTLGRCSFLLWFHTLVICSGFLLPQQGFRPPSPYPIPPCGTSQSQAATNWRWSSKVLHVQNNCDHHVAKGWYVSEAEIGQTKGQPQRPQQLSSYFKGHRSRVIRLNLQRLMLSMHWRRSGNTRN